MYRNPRVAVVVDAVVVVVVVVVFFISSRRPPNLIYIQIFFSFFFFPAHRLLISRSCVSTFDYQYTPTAARSEESRFITDLFRLEFFFFPIGTPL